MHNKFRSISDVIDKEKEFEKFRKTAKDFSVVEDFSKLFPDLKEIAQAVRVSKGTLYLRVENSVWKSELNFQRKLIAEKINNHYKDKVISTIRFL